MWRFWTCVFICFLVECRRIHEPINDNYKKASKKDISESTKDQKTEEGFDLGNCTDCKEENQKLTETKAPISSNDLDSKKTKKSDSPSSENAGRKGKAAPSGRKRNPNKKEVMRKSRNRKHKKNRKSNPRHKPENLLSDPTDNSSQDRWGRQKLKQLPEVARLEQRLHPTVKNPIHNMVTSMDRILRTLQYAVRRVDGDYYYMFNATRYNIMMTVREELMNIAKENDKAYDAVLQASLLTKDIYRRAHERHLLGPRTIPAAVSSKTMPKLRHLRLRDDYILAREELQKAERLKHTIARAERKRYDLQSGLMKVQRQVEEKLPARALTDLIRISNQTLRVLETTFSAMDVDGRAPLYGLMHRNGMENLREARDLSYSAKHILSQAKTQILIGRNFRNQIQQRVRERTPDTRGDMPFDETRMMLWAVVDSARIHAEKLFKTAANIHMKLKPILKKAREVLADKDKGTLSRKVEEKTRELRAQIKDLQRTLDKIRVKIGNEDILRARCEELQTSANWFNTDTIIDCDAYIITEGSGIDIDTDGSGDLVDEKIDIEIPRRVKAESIDKVSMSETKSNKTGVAKGKTAEEEDVTFSKGTIRKTGVTSTTDDEDMVLKKSKPETTTVAMTSTVETVEDVSENDDFTFVDWFGLLADDPMTELVHSDIHGNQPSLNELILDQLALYSKTSKAVLSDTDKTKEGLEDLQMKWNETKMAYKRFENNVLSTKVFLHGWAAKKAYVDSVHDRVMSLGDTIDLQSTLIENQCSVAVGVAEKKLEQAEERRDKNSETAGTAADPEDVKAAKESVSEVKEHVKEILQLKQIHPDPCSVIQNIDSTLKTNISELRKKIEQAKLITSTLQLPVSLQSSGYLTLPLDHDDKTKLSRMSLAMSLKSNISDGSVAVVKTKETGSLVISVKNSAPVLTVLDKDDYNVGELTSDMLLEEDTTYRIFAERLGSLFNFFVYNTGNENLDTNDSMLIDSVAPYQLQPSVVYVAGAPEDSPTFASESWQGCLSQFSVNGRYLNLFQKDSDGNLPEACPNLRSVQLDESLVLGGSGYAKLGLEPLSSLSRGTMDDMKIKFKAYTDGVIVHIESTSRRAFELVQIENGRIVVSFKNYYGQTTLQSKQDTFKYSVYQDLQIKVKPGRQPKLEVLLDGDTEAFESRQQSSDIQDVSETSLFIGGLPKLQNSSLSGCIKSLLINEKELSFSTVETSYDVNYGVCEEGNCVKFIESSHPVDIGEDKGRNSLMMSFTYGSVGNILEYSKGEKFSITVTLDTEGLDIYEAVGEVSEQIYLETFKEGSMVTVNIESSSKEVEIKVDKVAKAIPYESGSVWGGLFSDEKDEKYKIIVGGSSDNEDNFKGTLIDLFMNGRPFDTSKYLESNNLVSCTPPRAKRRPLTKEQEVQTFTCEEQNL